MNKKKYNSITARVLANKYKLKLKNIKSHRQDNKITIKDVKNTLKKLKKKIKKKNKFGKLDYIYQHIIIIDGNIGQVSVNSFIKTIFNNLEYINKKLIKEPQLYIKDNNIILKYKISEDDKNKLSQILENITIIFNKKYILNQKEIKISISEGEEVDYSLDDSDYELIDSSGFSSQQGKPDIPMLIKKGWFTKDNGWDEYDLSKFGLQS